MNPRAARSRVIGLPIAVQILALLVGGLVVAQLATLALTLLLPPKPPPQHSLSEIAQALRGGPTAGGGGARPLVRTRETAPPSLQSPGWLVSQRSTRDLAKLLGAVEGDVRLLFYAPPPLAGAGGPRPQASSAHGGVVMASMAFLFQAGPGGPGGGGPGGPPPGGFPGGGPAQFPSSSSFPPSQSFPPPGDSRSRPEPSSATRRRGGDTRPDASRPPGTDRGSPGGAPDGSQPRGGPGQGGRPGPGPRTLPRSPLDAAVFAPPPSPVIARPPAPSPLRAPDEDVPVADQRPATAPPSVAVVAEPTTPAAAVEIAPAKATANPAPSPVGRPLPAPESRGLFGLAPAPYVEGEFVAALRTGPNSWVTVKPQPEGFPNSWQRRVLLWFALSFAVIAPLGYLFARRLAGPLREFAAAAERLGRDPSAEVRTLEGPAEIGRAARAFNLMQHRLKRYVDDRTGMIGAISHDLRTPLARMRFRLERAPDDVKAAMSRDITQMEEMITSVLTFMREDAEGGKRDRVDLRSILEVVVDDAEEGGGEIELEPGAPVAVEVDVLGLQRVFENLVENALKYGERASLRLFIDGEEAVAEVADAGPGMSDDDLEQVFKPFYRGPAARNSSKTGIGLGLAVSRSTVRAHGGDLTLRRGADGLVAQVRLPLTRALSAAA